MGMLQARILEWVAMPSSRRSSQPRDRTQVSCIAGGFFTVWATREAQNKINTLAQLCLTLCNLMDCSPPDSSLHGNSPGKNTGVDCHAFLQEIFPTQGSNPGIPHCRQILYHLSHQGSLSLLTASTIQETWVWSLGQEDPPGEGNGNTLQYSCLKNPMDRGAWQAAVYGVTKNVTRLRD